MSNAIDFYHTSVKIPLTHFTKQSRVHALFQIIQFSSFIFLYVFSNERQKGNNKHL